MRGVEYDRPAARLFEDARQDLRFALRGLSRDRGFTLIAALTLAVGVGATTAVASLANAVLFRRLPVEDPDRLASIWEQRSGSVATSLEGMMLPYERVLEYREATADIFSDLAAHRYIAISLRSEASTSSVSAILTSGNYFHVLGAVPAAGRFFTRDDERSVVLGHRLWHSRFRGDPAVIGSTVYVDSRPFVVAGVAAEGFTGTAFPLIADIWVPLAAYHEGGGTGRRASWVVPFGRLRPGIEREAAEARIDAIAPSIPPEAAGTSVRGARLDPITMRTDALPFARRFVAVLVATGLLVLVIASANIAGMLLARSLGRRREVAVRLALGARQARLARQLLTETLVLFLLGGAGGILLALWGSRVLSAIRLPVNAGVVGFDATPDARVLAFGLALVVTTSFAFGIGPALRASSIDLSTTLKEALPGAGGRTGRRSVFVAAQLALSVLLLVTAGLFVRTLQRGLAVDPGFDARNVVTAVTDLQPHGYDDLRARGFYDQLLRRVSSDPAVESAALAERALMTGSASANDVEAAEPGPSGATRTNAYWNVVDTAYFSTMRIRLVAGRGFEASDREGTARVVVVNETLARRLWPGESAIGKRLREGRNVFEVVGIARDGKYVYIAEPPTAFAFLPYAQADRRRMTLHVRGRDGTGATLAVLERELRAVDPNIALESARPLESAVAVSLFPQRLAAILTGSFGLVGLLLAAIGVYAVLGMHVNQRQREFGIRMALGARTRDVLRLVLLRGAWLAAVGALVGLALAAGATRLLRAFLFGVSPLDPVTFLSVPALLVLVAVAASMVPAHRATRADPLRTLRQE